MKRLVMNLTQRAGVQKRKNRSISVIKPNIPKKNTVVLPVFPQLSLPSTTSFALGIFRTDSDMITVDNIMSEYNNILEVGQISDCSNCL